MTVKEASDWYWANDIADTESGRQKFMEVVEVMLPDLQDQLDELKSAPVNSKEDWSPVEESYGMLVEAIKDANEDLSKEKVEEVGKYFSLYSSVILTEKGNLEKGDEDDGQEEELCDSYNEEDSLGSDEYL